ncbi:MAG: pyridoxal phosphate-dependent aminotransferase [Actinomycetota bacterium]|nr:pyridoxal phosphate-dependent aminotransferase [Actinomycetota bacterium]
MARTTGAFDRLGDENAFVVQARASQLAAEGRDIVNLGIGQPDFRTPEHIVEAAVKALRDGHHGYTDSTGMPALRESVAAHVAGRTGVTIPADRVLIVPGAKVTMFAAIMMFGEPGVDILYPDPGFPIYRSMIEFTGARAVPVPVRERNGFALAASDVLGLLTPATRLLILNSPANPTAGVTPRGEVNRLVAGLLDHPGVVVLSDEIYDRMVYDGAEHVSLLSYPEIRNRLILLNGWSKTYSMTGWRLGWSIWPSALTDRVRRFAVNAWSCVNTPAQYAGIAALEGPQDCVDEMVAEFDRRRRVTTRLLAGLPGVSCVTPRGAFYAFPNITGTGWDAGQLARALLEHTGVALIGGADFGAGGAGYLRVSYANSEENIRTAMTRIGEFLSDHG